MKKLRITLMLIGAMCFLAIAKVSAQDETAGEESSSPFSVGVDVVSDYVWRGTELSGPSFQPSLKFTKGNFTAGVWGSFNFIGTYGEADPYLSYTAPFGLTIGMTDYYLTSTDFFNVSDTAGAHGFEINAGYSAKGFSINANYILNEAPALGTMGGDIYVQLGYAYKNFNVFLGGGNGWHTLNDDNGDDKFNICNIGLGATKEIKVSDSFTIPVFGQVILNPDTKQFFVVIGLSF